MKPALSLLLLGSLVAQTSDVYVLQPQETANMQQLYSALSSAQKAVIDANSQMKAKYGATGEIQYSRDFKTAIISSAIPPIAPPVTSTTWKAGFWTYNNGQPLSEAPFSKLTHVFLCCAASVGGVISQNWLEPASFPSIVSAVHATGGKVILSVGGSSSDLIAATSPARIAAYMASIVSYINGNGFDGVDIDWESGIVVAQYTDLLTRLRSALPSKLLTMDTGDWDNMIPVSVANFARLDRLNVMTYDMANGAGISWHNAAVYRGSTSNPGGADDLRTGRLISAGVPASKLNIGIPAYGYAFSGAQTFSVPGALFDSKQYWYSAIMRNSNWWAGGANRRFDTVHKAAYLSVPSTNQFITYNDAQSIVDIVTWGESIAAGGYFLAYVEQQYMSGSSGDGKNPLVAAMSNAGN